MTSPSYIHTNIFEELGLLALPRERQEALLGRMNSLVHKRMILELAKVLPPEAKDSLEGKNEHDQLTLAISYVEDMSEFVLKHVTTVREEMKSTIEQLRVAPSLSPAA